jgi:hypothetical protein
MVLTLLDRKYHRITLEAEVLLTASQGDKVMCRCIEFSNDGIDLEPQQLNLTHISDLFHAGQVVSIQVQGVEAAPIIKAAIVRSSPNSLSLRFIPTVNA